MPFSADDRAALTAQLKVDEGVRLFPYTDTTGKLTIGYGHNLTDRGITPHEAETLLDDDITETLRRTLGALPWLETCDGAVLQVVINLAFNVGVNGLLEFHQLLRALQIGNREAAAQAIECSQLAPNRRARLAAQMRTA